MSEEIFQLCSPIDVMYLIHKALHSEAFLIEELVNDLAAGGSLQPFNLAFNSWATAMIYHAEQEDVYLGDPLSDCQPPLQRHQPEARDDSVSARDSSDLIDLVRGVMVVEEEELHQHLMAQVQEVLSVLEEDIGKTSVITRTKQHLYRQVVALRIALEDHLESEEALVIQAVRQRMTEAEQLELAKGLLVDEAADEPTWMIDWVSRHLDAAEKQQLTRLQSLF
ncbi:MAG: hypothetical protein ACE5Q6_19805 [Dehalococcoidia bacterium]